MKITIDANKTVKPIKNFWNNIHFHPTDAIEDDWGQRILNRVAADKVAKTVRMYAMLEDIVTRNPDGSFNYDFTLNDTRIDYMLSKGFSLFLSYNFIPPCISSDPEERSAVTKSGTRYKGKFIVTAPPEDFGEWEEICRTYTAHIVERYGLETVSSWQLQCFNEPDIAKFFMSKAESQEERCAAYCKLYEHFAKGVLAVSDKLCVGGPALAHNADFLDMFLKYVKENNCRMDFICVHTYGTDVKCINSGETPINVRNTIPKAENLKRVIAENGYSHLPLIVDEWGASANGYLNIEECPELIFRETEKYAAYFGRLITIYDTEEMGIDKMMICLSGQHEMTTDFSGFRNFFTLNFFAKPIYNAYALSSHIEGEKLWCDTEYVTDDLSVFPAITTDGKIAVLLSYCTDDFKALPDTDLEIEFNGITEKSTVTKTVIDADNANAYGEFLKIGAPENLSETEILSIREKAELKPESIGDFDGKKVKIKLKSNSLTLIEITPCKELP